jgi:hypothetical protein
LALTVISIVAILVAHDNSSSVASIATAAAGVIGSVVGAYFGIKSGARNTENAIKAQRTESARAQVFAAHADPSTADALIRDAGLLEATKGN